VQVTSSLTADYGDLLEAKVDDGDLLEAARDELQESSAGADSGNILEATLGVGNLLAAGRHKLQGTSSANQGVREQHSAEGSLVNSQIKTELPGEHSSPGLPEYADVGVAGSELFETYGNQSHGMSPVNQSQVSTEPLAVQSEISQTKNELPDYGDLLELEFDVANLLEAGGNQSQSLDGGEIQKMMLSDHQRLEVNPKESETTQHDTNIFQDNLGSKTNNVSDIFAMLDHMITAGPA